MAQDSFGNYRADISPGEQPSGGIGTLTHGDGAPSGSSGRNGDLYVNTLNGNVYRKYGDSWVVISGGGGSGSGQIKYYTSNPNDENVTPDDADSPAIAITQQGGAMYQWSVADQTWK